MPAITKDFRKIVQIALPLLGALVAISVSKAPSQAATNHMLVIPASDGYGFDDCLSGGKACGQVIADAWCEAHGMAASVSFGRAEDITASIKGTGLKAGSGIKGEVKEAAVAPDAFIVNCRD